MKRTMVVTIALIGLLGSAQTAMAQTAAPLPKVEVSAGYQFQQFGGDGDSENWPKGWYADIAANLNKTFSLVGLVNGSYKTETMTNSGITATVSGSATTFMGGLRLSSRQAKNTVFVQALAGVMRLAADVKISSPAVVTTSDSESANAILVGAGFNAVLTGNLSLRIGGDFVRVFPEDGSGHTLRATAGLVYGFGRR